MLLAMVLLFATGCGQNGPLPDNPTKEETGGKASSWEIFDRKENKHKATTKPISAYTAKELAALPDVKQVVYKIVVSEKFKAAQAKPTIEKFIADMTAKDKDMDELVLNVYSEKSRLTGRFDVAMAVWGPGGQLEKVSPEVATTNNRDDYETKSHIRQNLDEYLERRGKFQHNEMEGLTEEDQEDIDKILKGLKEAPKRNPVKPLR